MVASKHSSLLLLGICLLFFPTPLAASEESDKAAILAMFRTFERAAATGDYQAILPHFHPNVRIYHPGEKTVSGLEAFEVQTREAFEFIRIGISSEIHDLEIYGDRAHVIGEYWHKLTELKTKQVLYKPGRFFLLMKKSSEGVWQVYRDMDQMSSPDWASDNAKKFGATG